MKAATDQLNSVMLGIFVQRAQEYLAARGAEPVEWRTAGGLGDALLHVTAAELRELTEQVDALVARYDERLTDPSKRPPGARPVHLIQMALPRGPVPESDHG